MVELVPCSGHSSSARERVMAVPTSQHCQRFCLHSVESDLADLNHAAAAEDYSVRPTPKPKPASLSLANRFWRSIPLERYVRSKERIE